MFNFTTKLTTETTECPVDKSVINKTVAEAFADHVIDEYTNSDEDTDALIDKIRELRKQKVKKEAKSQLPFHIGDVVTVVEKYSSDKHVGVVCIEPDFENTSYYRVICLASNGSNVEPLAYSIDFTSSNEIYEIHKYESSDYTEDSAIFMEYDDEETGKRMLALYKLQECIKTLNGLPLDSPFNSRET